MIYIMAIGQPLAIYVEHKALSTLIMQNHRGDCKIEALTALVLNIKRYQPLAIYAEHKVLSRLKVY